MIEQQRDKQAMVRLLNVHLCMQRDIPRAFDLLYFRRWMLQVVAGEVQPQMPLCELSSCSRDTTVWLW